MITIHSDRFIQASASSIFSLLVTHERLPEWCHGVHNPVADDTYPRVGGCLRFDYRLLGVNIPVTQWTTEHDSPLVFALRAEVVGGTVKGRWNLRPQGAGTRVFITYDYKMTVGRIAEVITELATREAVYQASLLATRRLLEENLESLMG